jgi:membrane protease YdiL (CAAX protease family)
MNNKPQLNYLSQFAILLGLIGVGAIIGSLIAAGMWTSMTGGSIFTMEKDMLNPAFTNAARWIQLVAAGCMFLIPAVVFARIVNRKPLQHLGFSTVLSLNQIILIVVLAFAAMALSGALGTLNEMIPISAKWEAKFKKAEEMYNQQVLIMAKMNDWKDYIFALVVIALAPAIFEEVLFRGTLQKLLIHWFGNTKAKAILAIVVTSIVFSVVHFSFYGFLARAGLGIVLGLIFYYSRNIWLSILLHFINNGIAVTALFVLSRNGKNPEAALKENFPWWYGIIALGIVVTVFVSFKKESEQIGALKITDGDLKLKNENNPFE